MNIEVDHVFTMNLQCHWISSGMKKKNKNESGEISEMPTYNIHTLNELQHGPIIHVHNICTNRRTVELFLYRHKA